jgi:sodium-dependent dicarboxylate transporter 2/3/5
MAFLKMDLHKRLALRILSHLGGSPLKYYVVLCWLLLLSMWMSNTATAMMMLPIVFSVTAALEETHGAQKLYDCNIAWVAYGCSIGGIATLVEPS